MKLGNPKLEVVSGTAFGVSSATFETRVCNWQLETVTDA